MESEIEPVVIGERQAVRAAAAAQAELGRRDETAMGRERPAIGADKGEGTVGSRPGLKTPGRLHHLNAAAVPPYDRAALAETGVEVERGSGHGREHNRNSCACNCSRQTEMGIVGRNVSDCPVRMLISDDVTQILAQEMVTVSQPACRPILRLAAAALGFGPKNLGDLSSATRQKRQPND